ncbi:unnamed protein product, partial [Didymodactylos carnosus]
MGLNLLVVYLTAENPDAGTFLSRAKQFTEEKLGQAVDKTEYDSNFEQLLARADRTKGWTERLSQHVESVLQPNPNERLEDFILTKLDQKAVNKPNNLEILGQVMYDAGNDFGPSTQYGSALIKCGNAHLKLGLAEKEFVQSSATSFIQPLKSYLDGEMKSLTVISFLEKERRILETKRLDLDAARSKKKKGKTNVSAPSSPAFLDNDAEIRNSQTEFDRQYEITRLMLDGITNSHNHHLRCLNDFVDSELQYHKQSVQVLEDLRKQLGLTTKSNTNSLTTLPKKQPIPQRVATVKFDYDATDLNEITIKAYKTIPMSSSVANLTSVSYTAKSNNNSMIGFVSQDGTVRFYDTSVSLLKTEFTPSSHLNTACTCLTWAPKSRLKQ